MLMLLSACGFHLRGAVELPEALLEMNLQDAATATDIAPDLRRALQRQGVTLSQAAPMKLILLGESYSKRVLSVDSEGRVQEYGLSYGVQYSLQGPEGEWWINRESVSASRDLRFDATAVLGTGNEEAQLQQEMRRDVVNSILRRLQKAQNPLE